jgi:hypothetical protein
MGGRLRVSLVSVWVLTWIGQGAPLDGRREIVGRFYIGRVSIYLRRVYTVGTAFPSDVNLRRETQSAYGTRGEGSGNRTAQAEATARRSPRRFWSVGGLELIPPPWGAAVRVAAQSRGR